jgi:hypothetical protein
MELHDITRQRGVESPVILQSAGGDSGCYVYPAKAVVASICQFVANAGHAETAKLIIRSSFNIASVSLIVCCIHHSLKSKAIDMATIRAAKKELRDSIKKALGTLPKQDIDAQSRTDLEGAQISKDR